MPNLKYTKIVLEPIVVRSISYSELCRNLGIPVNGGNIKNIKARIRLLNIDISHFTYRPREYKITNTGEPAAYFLKSNTFVKPLRLKKKLIKEGIKENKCENCGITNWLGNPISFELDHIDGDPLNNLLENLRLLCPNCHSQTETYCGKNKRRI